MGSPQHLIGRDAAAAVAADVTPAAAPPSRLERIEPLARTAAIAWLFVLACLALWSLGPMVLGWRPSVIVTGSMLPTVRPGDVVVVDPDLGRLRVGQIVLVRDPSMRSGQVAHRVVAVRGNGNLVTKGDANPTPDTSQRRRADVVGTVRLVVPGAGRLAMLRHHPGRGDLAWAAAAAAACLALGVTRPPAPSPGAARRPVPRSFVPCSFVPLWGGRSRVSRSRPGRPVG